MKLKSFENIYHIQRNYKIKRFFFIFVALNFFVLFLPWTQNIQVKGSVTTLYQEHRPQQLNSPIPGRISKWYVKNGDYVKKGDTLLLLSEIKDDYMDPKLVERTEQQVKAKKGVRGFYEAKVGTTNAQMQSIANSRELKLQQLTVKLGQLKNKLIAEEADLKAVTNELLLYEDQYQRQKKLYDEGLVSLTQFQQKSVSYQNALSKKTAAENKLAHTHQEVININLEQSATIQDYTDKLNKTEGEKFHSMGLIESSTGDIAKLENQVSNYKIRRGLYYVLASQDGQIVELKKSGIGEILKEGESIGSIIPLNVEYAVEIYIKPVDQPLIKSGQKVMCVFDGFPAIVFSGWPNSCYGTFPGKIVAIESHINSKGLFKALVVEDGDKKPWPRQIKIGTGVKGIAILNDVSVWYELWRNVNGFPPDFYTPNNEEAANTNEKKK